MKTICSSLGRGDRAPPHQQQQELTAILEQGQGQGN